MSLLYTPAVTLHSMRMMFMLMIFINNWFVPLLWFQHTIRKFQQRSNIVRFDEIYSISAFDFILHCIVIGMNSQWVLFILFAKRFLSRNIINKIVKLHVLDTCLCHIFHTILREWQFLCHLRQSNLLLLINQWIYIRYRMVGFKVRPSS